MTGYFAYSFRIKKTFPEKASLYGNLIKHVPVIGKNWMVTVSSCCPTKKTKDCMTFVTKMDDEFKNFHGAFINKKQSISELKRQNTRARNVKLP